MRTIPPAELADFNGLLASAVERGQALEPTLELLAAQASSARVRSALDDVRRAMSEGASLPEAIRRNGLFPPEYAAVVEAGLGAGRLAAVLRQAETYHALRARMLSRFRRLALYLSIALVLAAGMLGATAYLGRQIYPSWDPHVLSDFGFRRRSAHLGMWLLRNHWVVAAGLGAALLIGAGGTWAAVRWLSRRRAGYWIPAWGRLLKSRDLALFCSVTGLRLEAGLPLPEALGAAAESVPNLRARRLIGAVRDRVAEGESLSDALFYRRYFPRTLAWAVSLGERRSDVPEVLRTFARVYETGLERNFEVLFMLLSPLGVVLLGNIVLLSLIGVLFPLFLSAFFWSSF